MEYQIDPGAVFDKSKKVVTREIKGKLIIVPTENGIGDMEDELYTLNETGVKVWNRLDGHRTVEDVVTTLENEYDAAREVITREVAALMEELIKRKMLVQVGG